MRRDIGNFKIRNVTTHRIAGLVCGPATVRCNGNNWWLPTERISGISIDGGTESLHLPVAGHMYVIPTAHVKPILIEIRRTAFRIRRPMELPSSVQIGYFRTGSMGRGIT